MSEPILSGAEPFHASGASSGASSGVLVLHGFTGNPQSMRPLAEAFARSGFAVDLPVLPGHGTTVEEMIPTRWADWSGAAEKALLEMSSQCDTVVVAGLSMGGTLAIWLAERSPELAGIVVVNPLVDPPAESFREIVQGMLDTGAETMPGIGSDIAAPGVSEVAYEQTPLAAMLSLFDGAAEVAGSLGDVRCPVLLFSSREDHVVPVDSGDLLMAGVRGQIERVWLERSYHVATLDHDGPLIEERAVAFARSLARTAP